MALQFCFKYVLFSFFCLFLFLLGCYNFMTNYEENRCSMTYMFEYPQLVRISLPTDISSTYPKYGLYAYGEGRQIQKIRSMKFSGVPVLFIPGNRGSPNQVRSIASVAVRKQFKDRTPFHFDFFSLDLDEEYTGLFGGFLRDQTKFAAHAIEKILKLYKYDVPDSVILIGHSMGGLVVKGLFLEENFNPKTAKIIITLATPHSPVLLLDAHLNDYYARVNSHWDNNPHQPNVTFISVGGGPRDVLIKSSATVTPHAYINVITTDIPGVWLSVDHSCILWCNELVLVINRALFESVDYRTKQITDDLELRENIFNYHFLESYADLFSYEVPHQQLHHNIPNQYSTDHHHSTNQRSGSKRYHRALYPDEVPLWGSYRGENTWVQMNSSTLEWSVPNLTKPAHITVSLLTASDLLVIDARNHVTRDWIFSCIVDTSVSTMRVCKTGINLSMKAKILPHKSGQKRKFALVDLSKLRMDGFTHVVVRTLPTDKKVAISMELVKKRNRTLIGQTGYLPKSVLVRNTDPKALYYSIDMSSVIKPWNSYRVHVESHNCSMTSPGAVVSVHVPWSHEGSTTLIRKTKGTVPIVIYDSKPTGQDIGNVIAHVLLNPKCTYSIRLEYSFWLNLGAVFSKVGVSIISYITVCLLLTLSYQLKVLQEDSCCPLLHLAMPVAAKPYVVIQATALVSAVVQHVSPYVPLLPTTDIQSNVGFMEMLVIPLIMYLASFAIVYLAGIAMVVCIVFQGQAYNNILLRFLNKFFFGLAWMSEWAMSGANKVPIVVSAFMVTVAYSACGGLALAIGFGFYFFKMVSLYEDFWEEIVYWPLRVVKAKLKQRKDKSVALPKFQIPPVDDFSFHLTMLMLWTLATILHMPSVLTWAKNYRYNNALEPDPGFISGVLMSICVGFLWQAEVPKSGLAGSKYLSHVVFAAAVLVMTFAQTTLYRLPIIVSGVFICVTLHQLLAPWFTEEEEPIPKLVDATLFEKGGGGDLKTQISEIFQTSSLSSLGQASSDLPAGDDGTEDADSGSEEAHDDAKEAVGSSPSEAEGNATPSSDASTSSFEQISEREIT